MQNMSTYGTGSKTLYREAKGKTTVTVTENSPVPFPNTYTPRLSILSPTRRHDAAICGQGPHNPTSHQIRPIP